MHRFVLIDLWSQIEYIPVAVRRLTPSQFVDWLSQYGEIHEFTIPVAQGQSRVVYFKSPYGPEANFTYPESGRLVLLGDHYTYLAWKPENIPM